MGVEEKKGEGERTWLGLKKKKREREGLGWS